MIFEILAFYILALLVVFSALAVVTLRNLFHCAVVLVLTFIGVAGLFFLLDAPFVAAVQILIYVGAITVLLLFAIMLTKRISDNLIKQTNEQVLVNFLLAVLFLGFVLVAVLKFPWVINFIGQKVNSVEVIGKRLLSEYEYLIPFEAISVMLLAALIGSIVMAKKD